MYHPKVVGGVNPLPLPVVKVDHHVMRTPTHTPEIIHHQQKKSSFIAIDSKFLIIMNNYAGYNMQFFRARISVYELGQLHYSKLSISHFFFYYQSCSSPRPLVRRIQARSRNRSRRCVEAEQRMANAKSHTGQK